MRACVYGEKRQTSRATEILPPAPQTSTASVREKQTNAIEKGGFQLFAMENRGSVMAPKPPPFGWPLVAR